MMLTGGTGFCSCAKTRTPQKKKRQTSAARVDILRFIEVILSELRRKALEYGCCPWPAAFLAGLMVSVE